MPKRRSTRSREKDLEHYKNKIKKLEQEIRERNSDHNSDCGGTSAPQPQQEYNTGADTPALQAEDWLLPGPERETTDSHLDNTSEPQPGPSTATDLPSVEQTTNNENICDLDNEILEILGEDPSCTLKYGPEIHKELASRLLHIAKEGLSKETRKELISKYPVPVNCDQIDAPKINPEIKAAIADTAVKRDKGIETKQKQMTSAIACLSEIIHTQLNASTKNNDLLQKLMDIGRILCDLQHADSITRRNFILFALKYDMKEHLKNTKIDTLLFGENLAETLKTAKAVNKSGVELKPDPIKPANKYKGATPRALNRKAPPQARRQPAGSAPLSRALRSREPAAARAPYPAPPPPPPPPSLPLHAQSSRASLQAHQATFPRRRY